MAQFKTELYIGLRPDSDKIYVLNEPLIYQSDLIGRTIEIPAGFNTDFASVPRLPFIFTLWGDRAHREAVVHDYLYRIDSKPVVSISTANKVFLEAMEARSKPRRVRWPMYLGVCLGGFGSYHKRLVMDRL